MRREPLLLLLAGLSLAFLACRGEVGTTPLLTPTATPSEQEEIDSTLSLVADRTAALFGVETAPEPTITLLDEPALAELVGALLEDPGTAEQIAEEQALYRLLGLIPPDLDLFELYEELYTRGIAGLYRPEEQHIYVRLFGRFAAMEESTAAHEYAHYLQDVHYGLEAMQEAAGGDRDRSMALHALIEGDAVHVQGRYVAEHFNTAQTLSLGVGGMLAAAGGPDVPHVFVRDTTFLYVDGARFVRLMLEEGFTRDELYESPPLTTSQVLHPEKYRAGNTGRGVALDLLEDPLPPGWAVGGHDTLGELLLRTWVEEISGRSALAKSVAAGWDGDAVRLLSRESEAEALVARIAWSTPDAAVAFLQAAREGLDDHGAFEPVACPVCDFPAWSGDLGVLAVLDPAAAAGWPVLLAVAPTLEELRQVLAAVR